MEIDIEIKSITTGILSNNVYLVVNNKTKESFIIDPSYNYEKISEMISESDTNLKAILLTHGHFDHILSVNDIKDDYKVPVIAGSGEKKLLFDAGLNMSKRMREKGISIAADMYAGDGEEMAVAGITVKCIFTPGHTEGSVCWYLEDAGILFAGDTLFRGSYGRTDFPTGNEKDLETSIINKLFSMPADTTVYPGHGEKTDIGFEMKYNPINGMV